MNRAIMLALLLFSIGTLPALADGHPRPVLSEIVGERAQAARNFVGTVTARVEADLGFPLSGTIADRPVDLGSVVEAGDILARLDPESLEAAVWAAKAGVVVAANRNKSAADALNRTRTLFQRGDLSKSRLEAAEREAVATEARLRQARAALVQAQDRLTSAVLRAPHDGVVTRVFADPGAAVSVGQPVIRLAGTGDREVVIDLSEAELSALPPGAELLARLLVADDHVARIRLRSVDPVTDSDTRTRRAHFALIETPPEFRLGALVRVEPPASGGRVLTLPVTALFDGPQGPSVWIVSGSERRVRAVPVETGADLGGRIVITAGLKPGQEVVIKGVHSIEEGHQVGPRLTGPGE